MKKFLSVLCLLGLLVMPVVACAPEEEVEETDTLEIDVEEEPLETEMDEGMEEFDEMGTDMEEGMEEMDEEMEPPPAE